MWIYVCKEKDKANTYFEDAIKQLRKLANLRKEDESNNITLFMKVADKKGVKKKHLFE